MTEIVDNSENKEKNDKRPTMLLVVSIMSLVYMGWSLLKNIQSFFAGPMSEDDIEAYKVEVTKSITSVKDMSAVWLEDMLRSMINMVESINAHFTLNVVSGIVILLVGITGVMLMFNRRKIGFHVYIIYSILASVQIYLFVAPSLLSNAVVIFSLIISSVFILLYGLNLKWLK